jgi:hypothetical protein
MRLYLNGILELVSPVVAGLVPNRFNLRGIRLQNHRTVRDFDRKAAMGFTPHLDGVKAGFGRQFYMLR